LHLDLEVTGGRSVPVAERRPEVDAAVERLVAAGARTLRTMTDDEHGTYAVVLRDPAGNEVCVS
jgi:predicted enzyme related to lactoylglutathione lyase